MGKRGKVVAAVAALAGLLSMAPSAYGAPPKCTTKTVAVPAVAPPTNVTKEYHAIRGARTVAGDEVWAVGQYRRDDPDANVGGLRDGPLAERWDGQRMTPTVVPDLPGADADGMVEFNDVVVIDQNDVWAVGNVDRGSFSTTKGLAAHWDGVSWQLTLLPAAERLHIKAVAATGPHDVWAVAADVVENVVGVPSNNVVHVFHYDGTTWSPDTSATAALTTLTGGDIGDSAGLMDIDAIRVDITNSTRLTVVGWWYDRSQNRRRTLALYFDGLQWQATSTPSGNAGEWSHLSAVSFANPGQVWAVGAIESGSGSSFTTKPMTLRFEGGGWTAAVTPSSGKNASLADVDAHLGNFDVWQAGGAVRDLSRGTSSPIVEQFDSLVWRSVAVGTNAAIDRVTLVAPFDMWMLSNGHIYHYIRTCR